MPKVETVTVRCGQCHQLTDHVRGAPEPHSCPACGAPVEMPPAEDATRAPPARADKDYDSGD